MSVNVAIICDGRNICIIHANCPKSEIRALIRSIYAGGSCSVEAPDDFVSGDGKDVTSILPQYSGSAEWSRQGVQILSMTMPMNGPD